MLSGGLGVGFWTPFGVQLGVQKRSEKKVIFRERPSVRDLGQRRAPGGGGEVSAIAQTSLGEGHFPVDNCGNLP